MPCSLRWRMCLCLCVEDKFKLFIFNCLSRTFRIILSLIANILGLQLMLFNKNPMNFSCFAINWPSFITIYYIYMVSKLRIEHIQHGHFRILFPWKRTYWPMADLRLTDTGHHKVSFINFSWKNPIAFATGLNLLKCS